MNNSTSNKLKASFIINPFSGIGRHRDIERHLLKVLDQDKFEFNVEYTESPGHAIDLSKNAIKNGCQVVVAVGGDGTVNEVSRPLVGTNIPLGIIPSGSGNGLARHLGIPLETDKAIRLINEGNIMPIDTVKANDHLFLSIAGIGFDALVARKFAKQKLRGFFKYAFISITEFFPYEPTVFKMIADGKEIEREALFISFANSNQFGYNTIIAPEAKIDDGQIDICIVKKFPAWISPFLAPMLIAKKIDQTPYVEIIRAKEIFVKRKHKYMNLDGEPVKLKKRLHIRVVPNSLQIIAPKIS
jgi:YegS/Rv2252/BmrU family lipid kinase